MWYTNLGVRQVNQFTVIHDLLEEANPVSSLCANEDASNPRDRGANVIGTSPVQTFLSPPCY